MLMYTVAHAMQIPLPSALMCGRHPLPLQGEPCRSYQVGHVMMQAFQPMSLDDIPMCARGTSVLGLLKNTFPQ
jgi:hypothetical protein